MEAIEKASKTLSDNEGSKDDGFAVEKLLENGYRVSLNGKDDSCIELEDSEINGASSLLQMKESVGNIDVNGERNESDQVGLGNLLGAVNADEEDNVDKMIIDDDDDDDGGGVMSDFSAGYFVWGKIKSYPWWPGQVYDPTDASDYAEKVRQKGRLLVAYFGDSSFAWCHPSQLKPFEENFEDMSRVSSSKNFVNALGTSVDEIGRVVESKMTCSCVPKANCIGLERPMAANAGIKKGVLVPEGGIERISVGLFEPQEVLGKLKLISQADPGSTLLECAVLMGWLSAFNRWIGRPRMATYHEPLSIKDVEENVRTLVVDMSDYSEGSRASLRCPMTSEDGMDLTRKQKSIADILVQAPKVTKFGKRASSARTKKAKGNDKAGVIGAKDELDKEKTKSNKQASVSNGDDQGKEDTGNQLVSAKRKADAVPAIGRVDSFSRERKRSKYLCPPYTTSIGKVKKMDIEDESIEVPNDTRFELPEEVHAEQEASDESSSLTSKSYLNIDPAKVETPADEVLDEVRSIALSPQYGRKNSSFELVEEFLSAFRSSVYQYESSYKMYNQSRQHKRKSQDISTETKMDRSGPGKDIRASLKNTKKPKPYKPKMKETALAAVMKKNDKEVDGNPAALFVTFGPGSTLPKKDDLIQIYSRYGALDMEDTDVFYNDFCARVVFFKTTEAEQAYTSSENDSPFGSANVSFRLRVHQAEFEALNHKEIPSGKKPSLAKEGTERSTMSLAPGNPQQLNYIKQKLEKLKSTLETLDENMSSETKSELQSEIKGILEMVNRMVESSS